jgi:hypothetical protein
MRGTTKTFIETNIELIENNDWVTLFQGWYDIAYGEIDSDEVRFNDLMDTLCEADVIPFRGITLKVRKEIIHKEVEIIIQDWIDNLHGWRGSPGWIGMYYITNDCLRSHLGLDISIVRDIVRSVAINLGLIPDTHNEGFRLRS